MSQNVLPRLGTSQKKKRATQCPEIFVQQFITSNDLHYSCHLKDTGLYSQFYIGFRDCFGCGEQHSFAECPTKKEPDCYKKLYWNFIPTNPIFILKVEHRGS